MLRCSGSDHDAYNTSPMCRRMMVPSVVASRPQHQPHHALPVPIRPPSPGARFDRFERYTMPQLLCVHTGKGKSTVTTLQNVPAVARALGRPPSYLVRYFQYALSVPARGDHLSGLISADRLDALLRQFVREWVLCRAPACGLPECALVVPAQGSQPILLRCSACGHCAPQRAAVIRKQGKLVRHMRAHPPPPPPSPLPVAPPGGGAATAGSSSAYWVGRQLRTAGAFESHCRRLARWVAIDASSDCRASQTSELGGDGVGLPAELLVCILAHLDPESRYRSMQCCVGWLVCGHASLVDNRTRRREGAAAHGSLSSSDESDPTSSDESSDEVQPEPE